MKWLNSSTVRKTSIYYCISISKFPVTFCMSQKIKKICQRTCTERNRKKTLLSYLWASLSCWWDSNCWKKSFEFTDMMVLSSGSPHCELIQVSISLFFLLWFTRRAEKITFVNGLTQWLKNGTSGNKLFELNNLNCQSMVPDHGSKCSEKSWTCLFFNTNVYFSHCNYFACI